MKNRYKSVCCLMVLLLGTGAQIAGTFTASAKEVDVDLSGSDNKAIQALQKEEKKSNEAAKEKLQRILGQLKVTTGKEDISSAELSTTPVSIHVELKEKPVIATLGNPRGNKKAILKVAQAEKTLKNRHKDVKNGVRKINKNRPITHETSFLYNGFQTKATYSEIQEIEKLANVKSVTVDNVYYPCDSTANSMANVEKVWQENQNHSGYRGEKMVVAVLDTGIDVTHKDLRLTDDSNVVLTKEKVENIIKGTDEQEGIGHGKYYNAKIPYGYNYAENNNTIKEIRSGGSRHGQHVAGIIGANGENPNNVQSVVGSSPETQLLAMKVFPNSSSLPETTIGVVEAIEDSVKLGANVMNMSFGSALQSEKDDAEQIAIKNAANHGVLSVVAAGNEQFYSESQDRAMLGSPANCKAALTVASSNTNGFAKSLGFSWVATKEDGTRTVIGTMAPSNATATTSGTETLLFNEDAKYQAQGNTMLLSAFNDTDIVILPKKTVAKWQQSPAGSKVVETEVMNGGEESYTGLDVKGKIVAIYDTSYGSSQTSVIDPAKYTYEEAAKTFVDGVTPASLGVSVAKYVEGKTIPQVVYQARKHGAKGIIFYGNSAMTTWRVGDSYTTQYSDQDVLDGKVNCNDKKSDSQGVLNRLPLPAIKMNLAMKNKFDAFVAANNGNTPGVHFTFEQSFTTGILPGNAYWSRIGFAGKMSEFSSWGPTTNLEVKPDITGVGGRVYSLDNGENKYQVMDGTSMATPFVAGCSALVLQHLAETSPELTGMDLINHVKVAETNTATLMTEPGNLNIWRIAHHNEGNNYVSPRLQGSGLINTDAAVTTTTFMEDTEDHDGSFALKVVNNGEKEFSAVLSNEDSVAHSYEFTDFGGPMHEDALYLDEYVPEALKNIADKVVSTDDFLSSPWDAYLTDGTVQASETSLTLEPHEKKEVTFTLKLPENSQKEFVEGFVGFKDVTDVANKVDVHMPYLAFHGDYGDWSDNIPQPKDEDGQGFDLFRDSSGRYFISNENGKLAMHSKTNSTLGYMKGNSFALYTAPEHYVRKASVEIDDSNGETLRNIGTKFDLIKSKPAQFPSFDGKIYNQSANKYDELAEGDYTYQVKTENDFSTTPQVKEIPFTVDNTKPDVENFGIVHLPEDFHKPEMQEILKQPIEKGLINEESTGTYFAVEIHDNFGFDQATSIAFSTPYVDISRTFIKKPGSDKLFLKLTDAEATKINDSNGVVPVYVAISDGAGNIGVNQYEYKLNDGLNLYSANLNNTTYVTGAKIEVKDGKNCYLLRGSYSNLDSKLYVNNQEVSVDEDGYFSHWVESPKTHENQKYYFTTKKYDSLDEAKEAAIGYTSLQYYDTKELQVSLDLVNPEQFGKLESASLNDVPIKVVNRYVYDGSVMLTAKATGAETININNATSGGRKNVGCDLTKLEDKTFTPDGFPLEVGENIILAKATHFEEGMGEFSKEAGFYIVREKNDGADDVLFDRLKKETAATFDAESIEPDGMYNSQTQELSVSGKLDNFSAVEFADEFYMSTSLEDLKDEKNHITFDDNDFGRFEKKVKVTENELTTLYYSYETGDKEVTGSVKFKVERYTPQITFNQTSNWTFDGVSTYEVWTNQDTVHLKGAVHSFADTLQVSLNGNEIYAYDNYNGQKIENDTAQFQSDIAVNKNAEGSESDTLVNLTFTSKFIEGKKNITQNRKVLIHHNKKALSKVHVEKSSKALTFDPVTLTASTTEEGDIYWSKDENTWLPYGDSVSAAQNGDYFFKVMDKYGNVSEITKVSVTNVLADVTTAVKTHFLTKHEAFYSVYYSKNVPRKLQKTHPIEISEDKGKTWKVVKEGKEEHIARWKTLYTRVKIGDKTYSDIKIQNFE